MEHNINAPNSICLVSIFPHSAHSTMLSRNGEPANYSIAICWREYFGAYADPHMAAQWRHTSIIWRIARLRDQEEGRDSESTHTDALRAAQTKDFNANLLTGNADIRLVWPAIWRRRWNFANSMASVVASVVAWFTIGQWCLLSSKCRDVGRESWCWALHYNGISMASKFDLFRWYALHDRDGFRWIFNYLGFVASLTIAPVWCSSMRRPVDKSTDEIGTPLIQLETSDHSLSNGYHNEFNSTVL